MIITDIQVNIVGDGEHVNPDQGGVGLSRLSVSTRTRVWSATPNSFVCRQEWPSAVMMGKDSFLGKQIIGQPLTHPERLWQKMYDSMMHYNRRGWAVMCLGAPRHRHLGSIRKATESTGVRVARRAQRYFQTPESHPAIDVIPYCTIVSDQWDNDSMIENQIEHGLKLQQHGYRASRLSR